MTQPSQVSPRILISNVQKTLQEAERFLDDVHAKVQKDEEEFLDAMREDEEKQNELNKEIDEIVDDMDDEQDKFDKSIGTEDVEAEE